MYPLSTTVEECPRLLKSIRKTNTRCDLLEFPPFLQLSNDVETPENKSEPLVIRLHKSMTGRICLLNMDGDRHIVF